MKRDKLFDLWEGRDPEFEVQYEEPIIKSLCDYGKGTSQYQESRAKVLGAGYEAYINVSSTKIIKRESVDYRTPVRD